MITGIVLFAVLAVLGLMISVYGSGNPSLYGLLRTIVRLQLNYYWLVFTIIGIVLIAIGTFQGRKNN